MSPGTVHATDVILMICCYTVHLALNGGDYLVGGTSHRNLLWRGGRARKQQATDGGGAALLAESNRWKVPVGLCPAQVPSGDRSPSLSAHCSPGGQYPLHNVFVDSNAPSGSFTPSSQAQRSQPRTAEHSHRAEACGACWASSVLYSFVRSPFYRLHHTPALGTSLTVSWHVGLRGGTLSPVVSLK